MYFLVFFGTSFGFQALCISAGMLLDGLQAKPMVLDPIAVFFMIEWAEKAGCLIGISSSLMGLTVLAIGTSTPDAMVSLIHTYAYRKSHCHFYFNKISFKCRSCS